jgi:acetylornithine deacetylase/succinyl-diaminopimelate desuccinylase-like protein
MTATTSAIAYARRERRRFVDELKELVAFPTVSADPRHASGMQRCAAWLADHLRAIGLDEASIWPTAGHPVVFARTKGVVDGAPTLLIYGHYDVQPEGARADWKTPPFQGTIRGDELFARGASDDKGQLFAHIKALEAYLATGGLPVNAVCLFDGEEEIGSPQLIRMLSRVAPRIRADVIVISDTRMPSPDRPALTYALRGALHLEVRVSGPTRSVHAGYFGGSAPNPLDHLTKVVAGLSGRNGAVGLEGFYDRVRTLSGEERRYMAATGPTDSEIVRAQGAVAPAMDRGYSLYERTTVLPSLTVTRVLADPNAGRAAIPAHASAWFDIRLVPDQRPGEVAELVRNRLSYAPGKGLRVSLRVGAGTRPVELSRTDGAARAAASAYRTAFGVEPVFLRSGGSIGIVAAFVDTFSIPIVLMGFGLPGDGIHGPNEKFHLPTFFRGIETSIWFMRNLRQAARSLPAMAGR